MENFLRNDFINHFNLRELDNFDFVIKVNYKYFEIADNNQDLIIYQRQGDGVACISNPNGIELEIVKYDKFITSIPNISQTIGKRCDFIIYNDSGRKHIILGELKTGKGNRKRARKQLLNTLETLMKITKFQILINSITFKKCCYFWKIPHAPKMINAVKAFNRVQNLNKEGFKVYDNFGNYGFEFWEFSNYQVLKIE
jgi:hypothetical protein